MTFFAPTQALLEEAGPEGAVYASMGTLCNFGAGEFVEIARALSALPNLVIWKLAPGDLPGNATVASLNLTPNVRVRQNRRHPFCSSYAIL
jgi:hypothetical protein